MYSPSFPIRETAIPVKMEKIIKGRMWARLMTNGKSETVNMSTICVAISVFLISSTASDTRFKLVSSPTKCTTVNINIAAIAAVPTKIRIR